MINEKMSVELQILKEQIKQHFYLEKREKHSRKYCHSEIFKLF